MEKPEPVGQALVDHPLHERLGRILERAMGRPLVVGLRGSRVPTGADGVIGANAYLRVLDDRPEVQLALYPADILAQARSFYRRYNAVTGVRELQALPGWHVRPNFHFGHFRRGYCWTCNERPVDEYVQLWVRRIEREAAVPREDWDRYWSWLVTERIACPGDRPEFDRHFVNSNRQNAVPRPGLALSRRWPLELAQAPGRDDDLRREVRQALDEALAAFGACSPPKSSASHAR